MLEEETNIWGRLNCQLPRQAEGLCVACCKYLGVEVLGKPSQALCNLAHPGKGCDLHPSCRDNKQSAGEAARRRDAACGPFFCSPPAIRETVFGALPKELVRPAGIALLQLRLIATALELGQVTTEEAQEAVQRLLG